MSTVTELSNAIAALLTQVDTDLGALQQQVAALQQQISNKDTVIAALEARILELEAPDTPPEEPPEPAPVYYGVLTVHDGATDAVLYPLEEGKIYPIGGRGVSVVAETTKPGVSVKFLLDGKLVRTENAKPWAMFGDSSGNLTPGQIPEGQHVIAVEYYSLKDGGGTKLATDTVSFTVVASEGLPPGPIDPPPPIVVSGTVKTGPELLQALQSASGGETITMAPGAYGTIRIEKTYTSPVKLVSADPAVKATINRFYVVKGGNVEVRNLHFKYLSSAGAGDYVKVNQLDGAKDVSFFDCFFEGDLAHGVSEGAGSGTGHGLSIDGGTQRVLMERCEMWRFKRCVVPGGQSGFLTFRDNEFWHQRSDGFTFSGVHDVLIEHNIVRDPIRAPDTSDHADLIQFFTRNQEQPTRNVTIQNNYLSGAHWATQGNFMRNEAVDSQSKGEAMYYRNIRIENNVIHVAHYHGITIGEVDGLIVRNNSVVRNFDSDPKYAAWIQVKGGSKNVVVQNNIMGKDAWTSPVPAGWAMNGNVVIRNANGALKPYLKNPEAGRAAVKEDFRRLTPAGCDIDLLPAYG